MSARTPRFEVVQSDAGWFARFRAANGRIVWQTEVYQRQRGAVNACRLMAQHFRGWTVFAHVDERTAVTS